MSACSSANIQKDRILPLDGQGRSEHGPAAIHGDNALSIGDRKGGSACDSAAIQRGHALSVDGQRRDQHTVLQAPNKTTHRLLTGVEREGDQGQYPHLHRSNGTTYLLCAVEGLEEVSTYCWSYPTRPHTGYSGGQCQYAILHLFNEATYFLWAVKR